MIQTFQLHPAEVNVAISNIACGINASLLLLHLLRILLGPYPLPVIVGIYYLIRSNTNYDCFSNCIPHLPRINITLIISLLTAKTILMIAFIHNFNTMTSERKGQDWKKTKNLSFSIF